MSVVCAAVGCRRLSALRLSLGASDVTPEGLAALKGFKGLKRCAGGGVPLRGEQQGWRGGALGGPPWGAMG